MVRKGNEFHLWGIVILINNLNLNSTVSHVHPSIFGFYTQHISTCLFKVQCAIGFDVAGICIEIEEEAGTCWGIEEGMVISALMPSSHSVAITRNTEVPQGTFSCRLTLYVSLAEQWSIITGISDLDTDLGGAA